MQDRNRKKRNNHMRIQKFTWFSLSLNAWIVLRRKFHQQKEITKSGTKIL